MRLAKIALVCLVTLVIAPAAAQAAPVSVTFDEENAGSVRITSVPAGIDCPGTCSADFPVGSKVLLKAEPDSTTSFFLFELFRDPDSSIIREGCDPPTDVRERCEFTVEGKTRVISTFKRRPHEGLSGVSINDGDVFTNDANVELSIIWPNMGSYFMNISNDGGFRNSRKQEVEYQVPWKLQSSGPERLPKTVYVLFNGDGDRYTDDIILDETAPTLSSATASETGGSSSSTRSIASASGGHKVKLKTKATDRTSGVAKIQAGPKKSPRLKKLKYRRSITVSTSGKKLWVRVLDRAGNASKWKKVKVE